MISAGGAEQDPETGQLVIKPVEVLGPQLWKADGKYVLGADTLGRDVAVRVLYGGRNSLKIGIASALICTLLATILALIAGYFGGYSDWFITRAFDLIAALPGDPARDRARGRARDQRVPPSGRSTSSPGVSGSRR